MQKDWDRKFVKMAQFIADEFSKDDSTKVGAVVVGPDHELRTTGFNGFPRGINDEDPDLWVRPLKYSIVEHAERNAFYNATRTGVSLNGCTMYVNFEPIACTDCARGIIQTGIIRIVGPRIKFPGKGEQWEEDYKIANKMLQYVNIEQVWIENDISE